jgi:hypothetical protein
MLGIKYIIIIKNKWTEYFTDKVWKEPDDFCKGRSCDGCFTLKLTVKKHRELSIETYLAFIAFKKLI